MPESVNLTIDGLSCACTRLADANFSNIAAIYIVICVAQDKSWTIVDIGQSGKVGNRIDNHDRQDCWKRKCPSGNTWVCVYPTPTARYSEQDRLNLEHQLRSQHSNLCGVR